MNTKHTDEYPLSTLEPFIFIPKEHYDQLIRLCEDLEPLRREVAMLHRCLELYPQHFHDVFNPESECEICAARTSTQATALAYEREVKAKIIHDYRTSALVPTEAEEYLETSLMTWDLLDEVEAYRNGVALTHCGADPVAFFHDKYRGLLPRKFLVESLEKVRRAAELRAGKGEVKNGN